ncbi:MAG: hypothetical protein A3A28_05245 [Candidatus Sungbacteria bacterium RIFCSPLOWO2_01_FULL_47_32]|uniref:Uncharacterized protein n=1 Tax=Candidatus Sungbacteria bacterium RIFCSPHIGHO2_01_FULL_47_32 TaxID=1802264 RepID=A0A1G2K5M6_9BACT|nr:MAG: hypothetical protein A2633_05185 [Candidatus Sungbacteria bacterium RIFCSPHIGHO2_01_FULL_47_32]OHA06009.1 MAG: hypothetical protein A3A28_05245 [Candidatus Sungbacteria bacterium RIFCSPLOWO2_01_FULL_47_32]
MSRIDVNPYYMPLYSNRPSKKGNLMKRVLVLLIVSFLLFSLTMPISAKITVVKPNLPDYSAWPYKYSSVCWVDGDGRKAEVSVYGKAEYGAKSFEYIFVFSVVSVWYVHVVTTNDVLSFFSVYRPYPDNSPGKEKWTKFDWKSAEDYTVAKEVLSDIESFMKSRCPKVDGEITEFFTNLFQKAGYHRR